MSSQRRDHEVSRRDFLKLATLLPLLKLELPDFGLASNPQLANQPNILVLVFDTLSARHLPIYGYPRDTAPNISRFADRSTVYHAHYASANFTSPATASLFTGTYPWSHRAFHMHGTMIDQFAARNFFSLLPDGINKTVYTHNLLVTSLLQQFRVDLDQLMNTRELSLVDGQYSDRFFPTDSNVSFWSEGLILRGSGTLPSSIFLSHLYRLIRLAYKRDVTKEYGQLFPRGVPNLNDIYFILEDAVDWIIGEMDRLPRPFLGYFHFLPPHEPYTTRRDFIDCFRDDGYKPVKKPEHIFSEGRSYQFLNQQRREYDEYIAYTDAEFGRLLDYLERSGMLENTYVILTSDHGELFERGIRGHVTRTLYEPLIQVPLLISQPAQKTQRNIYSHTSCVDLAPTLLYLTGQPVPDWSEGSILPGFGGQEENPDRTIFALEAKSSPKYSPITYGTLMMRKGNYKLIHYMGYGKIQQRWELYDLKEDPEELVDQYSETNYTAQEMRSELLEKLHQANRPYQES
jgi:arylsulfatase A-like enzyme